MQAKIVFEGWRHVREHVDIRAGGEKLFTPVHRDHEHGKSQETRHPHTPTTRTERRQTPKNTHREAKNQTDNQPKKAKKQQKGNKRHKRTSSAAS